MLDAEFIFILISISIIAATIAAPTAPAEMVRMIKYWFRKRG
jgi:hypothetical protein